MNWLPRQRLVTILEHEPSWFAECMSAVGILLWSCFALVGDDFDLAGGAVMMPMAGLVFGPARLGALFHLDAPPRVIAACLGFVWWAWLLTALGQQFGLVPSHGAFAALAIGDALTVCRFSIVALRLRHGVARRA